MAQRNPPWTRDELILALDLYLRHRDRLPDHNSDAVLELSALLNKLHGIIPDETGNFRNANGVYMKLGNFRALDPQHTAQGKLGLTRGGRGDREVWAYYIGRQDDLHAAARAIKDALSAPEDIRLDNDDSFLEAPEGRLLSRMHFARERSGLLVRKKKADAVKSGKGLICEACGFDFVSVYGSRGNGFIECHHIRPLHTLQPGTKTRLCDLVLICSNCHRMIHARSPWLSLEELKSIIAENRDRQT